MDSPDDLTPLLHRLQDARTRATYGAVAGVVGGTAQSVMKGRPRNPLHSWVVNKQTKRPTHYVGAEHHPNLFENARVIQSADDLAAFLDARRRQRPR